ncbi:MAG: hypothetical protein DWQ02_27385 [Bacteroidetes bacterium]|nr:MAG: hypothetical protein DWQ02_27385 [Bacteroidota bacterium]
MIKRIAFILLVFMTVISCKNDVKKTDSPTQNMDSSAQEMNPSTQDGSVTVHEIEELRLTLPSTYKNINSVQELEKFMQEEGGQITKTDPGLTNHILKNLSMDRLFYFDSESEKNFNYVYVDPVGPRFPLQDELIEKFLAKYENDCSMQYASQNYQMERLGNFTRSTVFQNEVINIKYKHTLDKLEWYSDYYYIQMKGNRRSLVLIANDYNGGALNLKEYLTTIY